MTVVKKIAPATVVNRHSTPIMAWIRNRLLAVYRVPKTPPPGLPGSDGQAVYNEPLRFANNQSTRSPPLPSLPGGVHHKLAANYYLDRDARRAVLPPPKLYHAAQEHAPGTFADVNNQPVEKAVLGANIGPKENFGLKAPTPGFGIEWTRNLAEEQESQRTDISLAAAQKFDKYIKLH